MSLQTDHVRKLFPSGLIGTRILLIVFFSVGIIGIIVDPARDLFISLTPLALFLSMAAVIVFHKSTDLRKEIILFVLIYIAGFLVEAAGVNSGKIFGIYSYGTGLGIKVLNTPLMIGANWALLVYCTSVISDGFALPLFLKIPVASLMMLVYDIILEQVAPVMNMWSFEGDSAPIRNYIVWYILALIFHSALRLSGVKITNRIAPFIFLIQAIFFFILTIHFRLDR